MTKPSPKKPFEVAPPRRSDTADLLGPIQRPYPGLRSPAAKAIRNAVKAVLRQRASRVEA